MTGSTASNLIDQRDVLIKKLSEKVDIQLQQRDFQVVDVNVAGIPIVMGTDTIKLEVGLNDKGSLGISPAGTFIYQTAIDGGQLGGLLSLYNTTVNDVQSDLDNLASGIINQVNQAHCQGVGSDGSFTELTSESIPNEAVGGFVPPVSDGSFFIRVTYTNPVSHEVTVTRHEIAVHPTDTLNTIAARIASIPQLNAFVADNRLTIQGQTDCKFDFLPAVLSSPSDSTFTAGSPPDVSVSGIYTGTENQTFTFTASGADSVGNGALRLEVRDGAGQLVNTVNIGSDYAPGDKIDLGNGIKIAISAGQLNNGDSFTVDAYANTDTSGFLSSVGLNSFFTGSDASHMDLSDNVANSPGRIATALGGDFTDNANALKLASVKDLEISNLDSLTPGEFYRKFVANIGQQLSIKQTDQSNGENLMQTLNNQQTDISGVDINEEAAQMLVFEQMFQAMAKYLTTVNTTISGLMDLVQ
jgi:flagellar hook-associated protein 1 FlgK